MDKPLCERCANREDDNLVFNGARYVKQAICVYGMQLFPRSFNCNKFEPEADDASIDG